MADVQLEHGFTRTANRLDEAITYADFTGTQHDIVRCIIRQTYGWGCLTVRISHSRIADLCHLAFTGGFRRALEELVSEGVVIEVESSSGRTPGAYMLNKDFENWGRFSVPEKALERLSGERPPNADDRLSPYIQPPQGPSTSIDSAPLQGHAPPGGIVATAPPPGEPPQGGVLHTIGERQVVTATTAGARENGKVDGLKLVMAANTGLAEHPTKPQRIPRILPFQGATVEAVEQLETAGVTTEFAESAIFESARKHRSDTEIRSLLYFVPGTIRRWQEAQQAAAMAAAPRPASLPTNEAKRPTPAQRQATVEQERHRETRRAALDREYTTARRAAVDEWAKRNPDQYQAIRTQAREEIESFSPKGSFDPDTNTMHRGVVEMLAVDVHQVFPTSEEWLESQGATV